MVGKYVSKVCENYTCTGISSWGYGYIVRKQIVSGQGPLSALYKYIHTIVASMLQAYH